MMQKKANFDGIAGKSNFSYMTYLPSEQLRDYIECYWEFQIDTTNKKCFNIVPDAMFDLILTISDNQIISSVMTGLWDKNIEATYNSSCKNIGIRFRPIAIQSLIKQSIGNFLNGSVTFDIENFKINKNIFLHSDNTLESCTEYLNNLFERLIKSEKADDRLIKLYKHIDYTEGNISVDELSYNLGLSTRQIHRIVSCDLGISPKTYIQIVRVKKLLEQINRSNLYPDNKFFDQSHFIKNIKRFSGYSPKKFATHKNVRFIQF